MLRVETLLLYHYAYKVVACQEETQGETNHHRSAVGGCNQ